MSSGWKEATFHIRCALILCVLSFLLFLIGFSTVDWGHVSSTIHTERFIGLWKYVFITRDNKRDHADLTRLQSREQLPMFILTSGWYRGTQAMECLGLITMVIAVLIMFLYFFVPSCKQRKALVAVVFFTFLSVFLILVGVAIFGSKMSRLGYSLGWSLGLAIAGAVLAFIAGILELLELRSYR